MTVTPNQNKCLNCGQDLLGKYCHACGQKDIGTRLSFAELVRDFLGDMFTYDSRFYRTMVPLLIRPGFLTLEYYRGRRIRYVPPLRLFLFISFVLFLWFTSVDTGAIRMGESANLPDDVVVEIEGLQRQVDLVGQNPRAFIDLMTSRLPYLMFLMLPVLAGIFWLHYSLSNYTYLQHLVFALHFQSFLYLLTLLVTLANVLRPGDYGRFAALAVVVYLAMSLRRAFGSTVPGSIAKALSILLFYFFCLGSAFFGFLYLNLINFG